MTFKVIIAGSRSITTQAIVSNAINAAFNKWMTDDQENWKKYVLPEIVSGGAYGVDWLGEKYAKKCGFPCKVFPADWNTYGKRAGFLRNQQMAEYADALVAVWDGQSKGTKHMIDTMVKQNKLVYVHKEEL